MDTYIGSKFIEGKIMEPIQTNDDNSDQRAQPDVTQEPPTVQKKSMMSKCLDLLLTIRVADPDEAAQPNE